MSARLLEGKKMAGPKGDDPLLQESESWVLPITLETNKAFKKPSPMGRIVSFLSNPYEWGYLVFLIEG